MKYADRQPFMDYLFMQAERYDKNLSPEKQEVWWRLLSEKYSFDEIKRAFDGHEQDDRNFRSWPTVVVIERILNSQLIARGHQSSYSCGMGAFQHGGRCGRPGVINVGEGLYACHEHYEEHRGKTDIDKKMAKVEVDFEREARELGLTNRQHFFKKRGRDVAPITSKEVQEIENKEMMREILGSYRGRGRVH